MPWIDYEFGLRRSKDGKSTQYSFRACVKFILSIRFKTRPGHSSLACLRASSSAQSCVPAPEGISVTRMCAPTGLCRCFGVLGPANDGWAGGTEWRRKGKGIVRLCQVWVEVVNVGRAAGEWAGRGTSATAGRSSARMSRVGFRMNLMKLQELAHRFRERARARVYASASLLVDGAFQDLDQNILSSVLRTALSAFRAL